MLFTKLKTKLSALFVPREQEQPIVDYAMPHFSTPVEFDRVLDEVKIFYGFYPYNGHNNFNKGNEQYMGYLYLKYGQTRVHEAVNALSEAGYKV